MNPNDMPAAAAPPIGPRFDWPDTFGTRFAIMIDTEEEFDWSGPFNRDARGVSAVRALPDMHRRFADRGVPLTYLVDHPIASTPEASETIAALLADGVSAVGAHLHPWVNPPHLETVSVANSFAGNLSSSLERAKLEALGEAILRGFGQQPRIFRAGRYGMGPATHETLAALGYVIDTSMRARFCYLGQHGPDFRHVDNHAFRAGPGGVLLELPLTTVWTGALRRAGASLYDRVDRIPRGRGIASRLGLLDRVSLTPEGVPVEQALQAVDRALADGVRLLNFSFHSPTVQPGMTPYVRDAGDLRRFHAWWDAVLDLLARRGVAPVPAAELLATAMRDPLAPAA
ncbi:polysaccharide deacetylase family protein [Sphingomonas sp.]|uniref:polysaccharide deacetylase family protein n=1 Tax=Sphingomonas sp. TaxID=28214 RepID=UPI002C77DFA5|nr:polysaccharide deacetylase family protein [Sphingomonas sp.]HTG37176.1 polysaccharide deacetylase family protein [Sphingomonas sp.]